MVRKAGVGLDNLARDPLNQFRFACELTIVISISVPTPSLLRLRALRGVGFSNPNLFVIGDFELNLKKNSGLHIRISFCLYVQRHLVAFDPLNPPFTLMAAGRAYAF